MFSEVQPTSFLSKNSSLHSYFHIRNNAQPPHLNAVPHTMAHRNDSSQFKECFGHMDIDSNSSAGSSGGSSKEQKIRFSQSSGAEAAGSGPPPATGEKPVETYPLKKLKKEPECHMELEKLFSNSKHTVLVDPSKPGTESRWKATQRALEELMKGKPTVRDVEMAIKSYNSTYRSEWPFDALFAYVSTLHRQENNFSSVISRMAKLALQLPDLIKHPIPLLRQNRSHAITISQEQISCLLANAFFCTFPHRNSTKPGSEYGNFPSINFSSLFGNTCGRKTQKLRAIFHYFNTVTAEVFLKYQGHLGIFNAYLCGTACSIYTKPDGLVTFARISVPPSDLPIWKKKTETLTNLHCSHKGSIEKEGKGMLQVDFACKFIGGGVLGRGLVQEEIQFLLCPELIVARLFTEKLADNECLKITGVQTYSTCSGYSDSFEWQGPNTDDTKRDKWRRRYCQIVAIDALSFKNPREQYTEENIKRELNKAYVGFKNDPNIPSDYTPAIATGNWGCGAFNGDSKLKALIQMMAAAVAGRDLAFFTFGNKAQAQELQTMHDYLRHQKVTVGDLYVLLQKYCQDYSRHPHKSKTVFEYIKENTGSLFSYL